MITEQEIQLLKNEIYAIIESDLGREIVDAILKEKYGRQYASIKQKFMEDPQK